MSYDIFFGQNKRNCGRGQVELESFMKGPNSDSCSATRVMVTSGLLSLGVWAANRYYKKRTGKSLLETFFTIPERKETESLHSQYRDPIHPTLYATPSPTRRIIMNPAAAELFRRGR